jgi:hypothetical protein
LIRTTTYSLSFEKALQMNDLVGMHTGNILWRTSCFLTGRRSLKHAKDIERREYKAADVNMGKQARRRVGL